MGSQTPNYNLYKPDEGENNWADEVNSNFDTIDSNLNTDEDIEDIVGALVAGGTNITATYDDGANTLTIDTSALDEEEVEDTVSNLITAGNAITVSYNDVGDSLTIGVDEGAISHDNIADVSASDHHTRYDDSEAISAINNDVDHGSTAQHDYADVSDNGTQVVAAVQDINFGSALSVSDDGDETVTVDSTATASIQSYSSASALPDPGSVSNPQIAYLESEDDYVGVFQS